MKFLSKIGRRLTERSTLGGVAVLAAPVVAQKLGLPVDVAMQGISLVLGGALIGRKETGTLEREGWSKP